MTSPYLARRFNIVSQVAALAPGHPVFMIVVDDDSKLVIKREDGVADDKHVGLNLRVMKSTGAGGGGKVLDKGELDAVQNFLDDSRDLAAQLNQPEAADVQSLRSNFLGGGGGMVWFKMAEAPGLMDVGGAIQKLAQGEKTGVRAVANALNAPGGFETLGKIIAADLVNGNVDRFSPNARGGSRNGSTNSRSGEKYRTLINAGNVLLQAKGGVHTPVGLDSFYGGTVFRDTSKSIGELEDYGDETWGGRMLSSTGRQRLKEYAKDIYDDLVEALGPRNRKVFFLSKNRLDKNGPQRLYAGMIAGRDLIKSRLAKSMGKSGKAYAGLQDRYNILNS